MRNIYASGRKNNKFTKKYNCTTKKEQDDKIDRIKVKENK